MQQEKKSASQVLRLSEVADLVGLGPGRVMQLVRAGDFPHPIRVGSRTNGWLAHELEAYIAARAAERQKRAVGTEHVVEEK